MVDYAKDDTEPPKFDGSTGIAAMFIFPALRRSKESAEAGRKGMAKRWAVNNGVNNVADNESITQDNTIQDKDKTNKYSAEIRTVIDYLNEKAGTNYRHNSDKAVRHISARLNDGYTVDDMKRVIDTKVSEWKYNGEMSKFLRPETLFGSKFDGYLNQPRNSNIIGEGDNDILPY